MLRAIMDLLESRPHMGKNVNRTVGELHAYHEGYYTGLVYALRVLDLAVNNYQADTARRRARERAKRSASA